MHKGGWANSAALRRKRLRQGISLAVLVAFSTLAYASAAATANMEIAANGPPIAEDVLNGLSTEVSFSAVGEGHGWLTVRIRVLEETRTLRVQMGFPQDVRVLEGAKEFTAPASIGEEVTRSVLVSLEEVAEIPVYISVQGHGGLRTLSSTEAVFLERDRSGTVTLSHQPRGPVGQLPALPVPPNASPKPAYSPGAAISRPPTGTPAEGLSPPEPPGPLTALTVTGCFYYVDADGSTVAARNVWVRVWDDDLLFDDLLWSSVVPSSGCWVASGLTMEEGFPDGNQDIYVQYAAWTNPAGKVIDGFYNYYSVSTPVTYEVSTSFFDSGSWLPPADANYRAAFRVYAYLEEAWQFDCTVGVGQDCFAEPTLEAMVPAGGTYYSTLDKRIRIEVNGDYDRSRDVVTHERGHWVMDRLLYEDGYWPPGSGGPHTWCGTYTSGLAWTEGWASFYALVKGNWLDPSDTSFEYGSGWSTEVESGLSCSPSVVGDSNEYRVVGALWDLWDGSMDGKDVYSTPWDRVWRVADDCAHATFRAFYDAACSWVSHGESRSALLFPAWQNYIDYDEAPSASVSFPNQGGWVRGMVTIAATATDPDTPVIEVLFFLSYGPSPAFCLPLGSSAVSPFTFPWNTTQFADSSSTYVCVQAYDGLKYGSIDLSDSAFGVDNGAPVVAVELTGTMGENDWYVSRVTVRITATDNLSGLESIEYDLDGTGWTRYLGPVDVASDGGHTIRCRAVDVAGNPSDTQLVAFKIDATPPLLVIREPADSTWIRESIVVVTWEGSDSTSGISRYEVSLDGGAIDVTISTQAVYPDLAEGSHVVSIRAYDNAGNRFDASLRFFVDLTPPVVSISRPGAGQILNTHSVIVEWARSDAGSGVENCSVRLDGGQSFHAGNLTTHTWQDVSDGDHMFRVSCVDLAGNVGEALVRFRVDTALFSDTGPYGPWPRILLLSVVAGLSFFVMLFVWRRKKRKDSAREMKSQPEQR